MRALASRYHKHLNSLFTGEKSQIEYPCGYRVRAGEYRHSLYHGVADSNGKCEGLIVSPKVDADVIKVPLPSRSL